ncbi:MAG: hypothetical protein VB080_00365 [Propionicimonas sp.]|uniref:hypothetical protein n=1 Tax=Propionicimonas sp. TaxID=1955623 RepID=UPI002B20EEB0|nr:hypothetical protein [Propionicimonas sp.]MEA4942866.1 hypothetical protein [Propionicimonas sp.]
MIVVVGATLPGLAAAARLARVGHQVVVLDRRAFPDRPAIPEPVPLSPLDPDPHVILLPGAWRDLFRKSGRPITGELGRHGLRLVPAPAPSYATSAGEITLPADRAGQWHTLAETVGPRAAATWRDLLDRLDTSWLALRPLGVEAEFTATRLDRATKAALHTHQTLADLARQAGPLGSLFTDLALRRDSDPRTTPGWLGTRLSIERTFGRWQLADSGDIPQPATRLLDIVLQRLVDRDVDLRWQTEARHVAPGRVLTTEGPVEGRAIIIATSPWQHATLTGRRPPRGLTAASTAGPQWHGWRTLLALPRLRTTIPGVYHASAFSPAGPEPWAQLLTGALAAYRVHEDLTGEDIRPTNKDWSPPRGPLRPGP